MSETDATGALYFTNALKFATETFEEFLEGKKQTSSYEFPIVSAKAAYKAPLFLNDEIKLCLRFIHKGRSSFTIHTEIQKEGKRVMETEIVHACISKESYAKADLPSWIEEVIIISSK